MKIADTPPKTYEQYLEEARLQLATMDITSDFMFYRVAKIEPILRGFADRMLDFNVGNISYHTVQDTLKTGAFAKGVRFDTRLGSDDKDITIEMQVGNYKDLLLRTRFYQAVQDVNTLKEGDSYSLLHKIYIIFICLGDPFCRIVLGKLVKAGLPIYTVEPRCREDGGVITDDWTQHRFFNCSAYDKIECRTQKDRELRALLQYFYTHKVTSDFTKEIDEAVEAQKEEEMSIEELANFNSGEWDAMQRGEERRTLVLANNMLKEGSNCNFVQRVTDLPLDVIMGLQQKLNAATGSRPTL